MYACAALPPGVTKIIYMRDIWLITSLQNTEKGLTPLRPRKSWPTPHMRQLSSRHLKLAWKTTASPRQCQARPPRFAVEIDEQGLPLDDLDCLELEDDEVLEEEELSGFFVFCYAPWMSSL